MAAPEVEIARLLQQYQAKNAKPLTIATVESATGGRVGDRITNIPGSSDYYKGSIIAYSNEVKAGLVGVKEETLNTHGAVSAETAIEMAVGGRKLMNVDICISDTGIAGPGGATLEKPVGLFYLGLSATNTSLSRKHEFHGNRDENKQYATEAALMLLLEHLLSHIKTKNNKILEEKHVVTCFLEHDNRILILKRSKKVGTYQDSWAGVSGYMETTDLEQAFTEINEEAGLQRDEVELIKKGKALEIIDNRLARRWIIHPFLFQVKAPQSIILDWEHTEMKWIKPEELNNYHTVPGLKEALDLVIQ